MAAARHSIDPEVKRSRLCTVAYVVIKCAVGVCMLIRQPGFSNYSITQFYITPSRLLLLTLEHSAAVWPTLMHKIVNPIYNVEPYRCEKQSSVVDGIANLVNVVPWRNFSKSTVVNAKVGHVSPATPLLGVICHPYGKT